LPRNDGSATSLAELTTPKPVQDRFVSSAVQAEAAQVALPVKPTKTAEAVAPTGGAVTPAK
jgi:hypothetical protein